jgi:putative salt-induced outer membrane protein YdiY
MIYLQRKVRMRALNSQPNGSIMIKTFFITTVLTLSSLFSVAAYAQDPAEEERPYDASASVGYVGTSGNTDVTTLNTEFLMTYYDENWTHNFVFNTLSSRQDGDAKAERYFIRNKSDYALMDEDRYLYAQASYTDDRFSGFDYQAAVSVGYGQYFLRGDGLDLQGFAGLGYRQNDAKTTGSEGESVLTLGEELDWAISETSELTQALTFEIGDKRTITTFEIALESDIVDRISTRIAFQYRNNSDVPVGIKNTDTQTSISLVYTF